MSSAISEKPGATLEATVAEMVRSRFGRNTLTPAQKALRQLCQDANFREHLAEFHARVTSFDSYKFCSTNCATKWQGKASHCPHSKSYADTSSGWGWR